MFHANFLTLVIAVLTITILLTKLASNLWPGVDTINGTLDNILLLLVGALVGRMEQIGVPMPAKKTSEPTED